MEIYTVGGQVINEDCRAILRFAKSQGWKVASWQTQCPESKCQNCGDTRFTTFYVRKNEYGEKDQTLYTYFDGKMQTVGVYHFPCQLCNGADAAAMRKHLERNSGLEAALADCRLEFFDKLPPDKLSGKESALASCRLLLSQAPKPRGWLTLYGDFGRGKTGMLASLVAGFVRVGVQARYIRAVDLVNGLQASFDNGDTNVGRLVSEWARVQFLAIDQIDIVNGKSDWTVSQLFSILDHRYNGRMMRATAIATNTAPGALPQAFQYLHNRMLDGEIIKVAGACLRG
jgi:DNA replication protein DnaC